jgi:predicted permease
VLVGVLPLLGGFAVGLLARGMLQHHFALAFRVTTAGGLAVLAFLAGWSFDASPGSLLALGVLLAAQLIAVTAGAWLFRRHPDGPLLAFSLYGNPGFWSVPVTAAVFGARPAVVLAAYDMLTQPRLALGLRLMRARAPVPQERRTALVDYSPMIAATVGVLLARVDPAPTAMAHVVAVLATVLAVVGGVLLGVAWPRETVPRPAERRLVARVLAAHLTIVPGLLLAATLAGLDVPVGAWVLALGPLPVSSLSLARLYGYSPRLAAAGLAVSLVIAVALLPFVAWVSSPYQPR